jgi:hypothetical protein
LRQALGTGAHVGRRSCDRARRVGDDREELGFFLFGQIVDDEPLEVTHWLGSIDEFDERGFGRPAGGRFGV